MVNPGLHSFNGWRFNTGSAGFNGLPTLLESKVSWSAESCASHPDPSRGIFVARVPRRVSEVLNLDIGSRVSTYVIAQGLDPSGSGVVTNRNVAYMEGYIDQVTKRRLFYAGQGDDLSRRPFHAVANAVMPAYLDPTVSVTLEYADDKYIRVPESGWVGSDSLGGCRVKVWNSLDSEATFFLKCWFVMDEGTTSNNGASGKSVPGTFRFGAVSKGLTVNLIGCDPGTGYEYEAGSSLVISDEGGGTIFAEYSITVPPGESYFIPTLCQESPVGGDFDSVELMIETSDALAVLGRTMVGDTPWYVESAGSRIYYKLAPAVSGKVKLDWFPTRDVGGDEPGGADAFNNTKVRNLDVDRRSALDVYRRTVASVGRVAIALAGRVGISWALAPALKLSNVNGSIQAVSDTGWTSVIPVQSLEDVPLQMSTDRMANCIIANYFYSDAGNSTKDSFYGYKSDASISEHGEVNRKIDTDLFDQGNVGLELASPLLDQKLSMMIWNQMVPRWYLDDKVKVVPSSLDGIRGLAELVDNATRYGRSVELTGSFPEEIGPYHRVKGSTFGFGADGEWHLELSLEPSDFSGPRAGTFTNAQPRADLTLVNLESVTIGTLRNVAL